MVISGLESKNPSYTTYYTATKKDMNILGSIEVKEVENIPGEIKTTNMVGEIAKRY